MEPFGAERLNRRLGAAGCGAFSDVRGRAVVVALLAVMVGLAGRGVTEGVWADAPGVGANALSTAELLAPTGPSATASCDGVGRAKVVLGWTVAARADGYDVLRSTTNGGPYTNVQHVTGGSSVSASDRSLSTGTTYYYVLRTTRNNWTSANSSQVQATTPGLCLA